MRVKLKQGCSPCVTKQVRKLFIAHVYKMRYMGFEPLTYKEFRKAVVT